MKVTMQQLREANRLGRYQLPEPQAFYLNKYGDELKRPMVTVNAGVVVEVVKVYRRGRAAMLKYTDKTGKEWWSWEHASPPYEAPRKYTKRQTT